MHIIINNSSMVPIYEQIVGQLKQAIICGELLPEAVLPSVRGLSGELRISALTVKKAYDLLEKEGFVATIHGKGTFVLATNAELKKEAGQREVEEGFACIIGKAKTCGMTEDETRQLFEIVMEDYYGDSQQRDKEV